MTRQRSIKTSISACGVGLHSGVKVYMTLNPAPPNTGIIFRRTDIDLKKKIKVSPYLVGDTHLHTTLSYEGLKVSTIEHLMSALAGLGIDNLMVDLDQEEVPIMDGSSSNFVFLLVSAGIVEQDKPKKFIKIKKPIRIEKEGKFVEFKPGPNSEFRFSMDFDHPFLKKQKLSASIILSSDSYIREISRARTFGFMRDIEYLKTLGLARGASLDNAVGIEENCIANKNGLRYEDEFVKHKILDALGDLYVSGYSLIGVYEAFKSGHELNNISIKALLDNKEAWEYVTFEKDDSEMPISYSICA